MSGFLESFNKIPMLQKLLMLLLLMALLVVGFWFLAWDPLVSDLDKHKSTIKQLDTEKTNINRTVQARRQIEADFEGLKTEKARLEKALPKEAEIPRLLQNIYGRAKIVGLKITTFRPGNERQQKLYMEIPVRIELRGTYDQVADFFDHVGRMDRIVNIKNISLGRVSGGEYGAGELRVTCQATTYRALPTPGAPK